MKKFNTYEEFRCWFIEEVNKETAYKNLQWYQADRFLSCLAGNLNFPAYKISSRIDITFVLTETFIDYYVGLDDPTYKLSTELKYEIIRVVKKKIFGWYPFNINRVRHNFGLVDI